MSASKVTIFEVGARDGLQNEAQLVPYSTKKKFIEGLVASGLREIELGAFVRPDRVPQMADTKLLYRALETGKLKLGKARPWSLVPNRVGLDRAIAVGAKHVAIFTGVTDSFVKRNIGMTVKDSLQEYAHVVRDARAHGILVRGYVSTAFGCPYEGRVAPIKALRVIEKLAELDIVQISIGDTIGVATPQGVKDVVGPALQMLGVKRVAGHFHDTRGTALANALRAYDLGCRTLDASAGGLGGCPFAPGATGNLATEDLVYMLEGMGIQTGVNLDRLTQVSVWMAQQMGRTIASRYVNAFVGKKKAKLGKNQIG